MEQRLTEAFDALHMEDDCITQIQQAMEKHRRSPARPVLRAAAAFCAIFMMIVVLSPATAQAVEEIIEKASGWFRRAPGTIVLEEEYTYYNDGRIEIDSRLGQTSGILLSEFNPTWLRVMDDRVYYTGAENLDLRDFLANKEQYDITGQFSAGQPFLASYEKDGICHYIAIGGDFDPEVGIDSIGCAEWLRRTDKMEDGLANGDLHSGWVGGSARFQYLDEAGTLFPIWYAKAVVELDIPWNNAEAKQQLGETE